MASGEIPRLTASGFNGVGTGLTCRYEWGPTLSEGQLAPFSCAVPIDRAKAQTRRPVVRDPPAELVATLAQQEGPLVGSARQPRPAATPPSRFLPCFPQSLAERVRLPIAEHHTKAKRPAPGERLELST